MEKLGGEGVCQTWRDIIYHTTKSPIFKQQFFAMLKEFQFFNHKFIYDIYFPIGN